MQDLIMEMYNWICLYYGDAIYLVLAIFAYMYMFVQCKEWRGKIFYPILLIVLCLLNPILYEVFFNKARYWRFFWMLPNTIVIAFSITCMVRCCKNKWEKIFIVLCFCMLILIKGTNVFKSGNFTKTKNLAKVSSETQQVCDLILEIDMHPTCVMPRDLFSEVRQYSGNIELLYGRDVDGYIMSVDETQRAVQNEMDQELPDYGYILKAIKKRGIHYVVVYNNKLIPNDILDKFGFQELGRTDSFAIYKDFLK